MDPGMHVGSSQDFRLTWVNYSQKLTESFHKFLTSEILCNVTLWVHEPNNQDSGGNSIKAHQAILSACSPWFEKILSQNQHPHPIIILKDVRYHDLKNIIRFIYTGEVFVPQHDLQDFLRTAELLEIKGLLKDDAAWPPQGLASLFQAPVSPGPPAAAAPVASVTKQNSLPTLPTVPVSSFLLPTANTTSAIGHITTTNEGTQIHDLVSQIKVPVTLPSQPVSKTLLATASPVNAGGQGEPAKRRKVEVMQSQQRVRNVASTSANLMVNTGQNHQTQAQKQRRLQLATTNNVTTQIVVEDTSNRGGPMMAQASVEEDGVSWIEEATGAGQASACTENVASIDSANLTPAEWVATGINDCGAFKRVWAERYLCYNLGREIICLLCFCRFTQFKKFNLERHMKNKHPQMYSLNETARREILEQFVARYIDHVSPENGLNHSSHAGPAAGGPGQHVQGHDHRSHDVASEILAIGPIQVEGINLEPQGSGSTNATTGAGSSTTDMHEIKVEESSDDQHHHHHLTNQVDLSEADSEMLLVK